MSDHDRRWFLLLPLTIPLGVFRVCCGFAYFLLIMAPVMVAWIFLILLPLELTAFVLAVVGIPVGILSPKAGNLLLGIAERAMEGAGSVLDSVMGVVGTPLDWLMP